MSRAIKNHSVKLVGPAKRRRALLRGVGTLLVLDPRQGIRKRAVSAYEALCRDTQAIGQDFHQAVRRETAGVRVR